MADRTETKLIALLHSLMDKMERAGSKYNSIEQFHKYPFSRAYAVKAKCAECVGCTLSHLEKGFKESIAACSSHSCLMHRFRLYQREKSSEGQNIALQNL